MPVHALQMAMLCSGDVVWMDGCDVVFQVRMLEMQMEEEQSERQKLIREKREVERRMQTLSEQQPARDRGSAVLRLRLFLLYLFHPTVSVKALPFSRPFVCLSLHLVRYRPRVGPGNPPLYLHFPTFPPSNVSFGIFDFSLFRANGRRKLSGIAEEEETHGDSECIHLIRFCAVTCYIGGAVVQRVEHWTCDQQVVGSYPTRGKAA